MAARKPSVCVVTTVAQWPHGRFLHLRNLRWALEGLDARFVVMTFKSHGLANDPEFGGRDDVTLWEVDADPRKRHSFHADVSLERVAPPPADLFMFVQQDNLFTVNLGRVVRSAMQAGAAAGYQWGWHDLVNPAGAKVMQRFSEVAGFLRGDLFREMIAAGVGFGSGADNRARGGRHDWFLEPVRGRDPLATLENVNVRAKNGAGDGPELYRSQDFLTGGRWSDTLCEATLYLHAAGVRVRTIGSEVFYHPSTPERMHRHHPEVYEDCREMEKIVDGGEDYSPRLVHLLNCRPATLMYLMTGVYEPGPVVRRILDKAPGDGCHPRFLKVAHQFMSQEEQRRLAWALNRIPF